MTVFSVEFFLGFLSQDGRGTLGEIIRWLAGWLAAIQAYPPPPSCLLLSLSLCTAPSKNKRRQRDKETYKHT